MHQKMLQVSNSLRSPQTRPFCWARLLETIQNKIVCNGQAAFQSLAQCLSKVWPILTGHRPNENGSPENGKRSRKRAPANNCKELQLMIKKERSTRPLYLHLEFIQDITIFLVKTLDRTWPKSTLFSQGSYVIGML